MGESLAAIIHSLEGLSASGHLEESTPPPGRDAGTTFTFTHPLLVQIRTQPELEQLTISLWQPSLFHRLSFTNSASTPLHFSFNTATSSHSNLPRNSESQLGSGYTALQVLQTKNLLRRRGLPLEVADTILDLAEYWAVISTTAQYSPERTTEETDENSGYLLYLRTQPLPGEFKPEPATGEGPVKPLATGCLIGNYRARDQYPVRKAVFQTVSRDQGWSIYPDEQGSYCRSYTWFEVSAERPKSITPGDFEPFMDAEVLGSTGDSDSRDSRWERISSAGGHDRGSISNSGGKNTWVLQRNVHAGKDWKTHSVVWKHDGPDSGPVNENTGTGMGADLLRCLKPGDRINLVARARAPGWRNRVWSAEVHVYYAV